MQYVPASIEPHATMNTLTIETGLGRASIALQLADGGMITRTSTDAHANATELLPMIENALAEAGIAFQNLGAIRCGIGPGSFTGIRIGLAAARGLGLALNIPVHGISTLAACADTAFRAHPQLQTHAVMVVIDAMREQLYTQLFRYENALPHPVSEPLLCDSESLAATLADAPTVAALVGNGAAITAHRTGYRGACRTAAGCRHHHTTGTTVCARTGCKAPQQTRRVVRVNDQLPTANREK
jgi:tRNA threonylcarbamoyladenosine biosynthesis protein TsaB